jgi:hypothetical protein
LHLKLQGDLIVIFFPDNIVHRSSSVNSEKAETGEQATRLNLNRSGPDWHGRLAAHP